MLPPLCCLAPLFPVLLWRVSVVCVCVHVCVSDVYISLRSSLRRQGGEINVRCGVPKRDGERERQRGNKRVEMNVNVM